MNAISDIVHASAIQGGNGNLVLEAVNGRRTFSQAFGSGPATNIFYYYILSQAHAQWEWGTGHISSVVGTNDILVRDIVINSSNFGLKVDFTSGPKDVVNDLPSNLQLSGITRNQIPNLVLPLGSVRIDGFSTAGDIGAGAVYTSIGADANSYLAVQDLAGTWFKLSVNGPVNMGWFGVVGDGVFDNDPIFRLIKTESIKNTLTVPQNLTISITSPAVFTLADHGFAQGTPLVFSTTGALPTGVVAGQEYWVTFAGLTKDTFGVSSVWPTQFGPDQPRINTSGTQSGVHSVAVYGEDWVDLTLPPGHYISSDIVPLVSSGGKKFRLLGYGSTSDKMWFNTQSLLNMNTGGFNSDNTALIKTVNVNLNQNFVDLVTVSDTSKFWVGGWVLLTALGMQVNSFPPNNHYFEYAQLTAIDSGIGRLTFDNHIIRNSYKSTYPDYGTTGGFPNGGPGRAIAIHPYWDMDIEVRGLHMTDSGQVVCGARRSKVVDCQFDGNGLVPSGQHEYIAENCIFKQGLECDKLVEEMEIKHCDIPSISIPSSSIGRVVIDGCIVDTIDGTARNTVIKNCDIAVLSIGPQGAFGASDTLIVENSRIMTLEWSYGFYSSPSISGRDVLIESWSFSNGTFSRPLATFPNPVGFAVPGRKCFVRDFAGNNDNMGSPFAILDLRTNGTDLLIDTTLTAKPVGNSTNSTVTIDIATPALIHWTSHGLTADTPVAFLTTGALPTGIVTNAVYYVLAAGLGLDSFEISTSPGGTAVDTSGTQSGTQTAISNPLIFLPHPMARATIRGVTGATSIASMSEGPADVPIFSYFKRVYVGNSGTTSGSGQNAIVSPYVWGNLVSLSVNVVKAYTGVENPLTLTLAATGFDSGLLASNFSQVIDLRTAGLRVITPTGVAGSVGVDSIAAYAGWISGKITMSFNVSGITVDSDAPIFEIQATTDQGITAFNIIQYTDQVGLKVMTDTNPGTL